MANTPIKLKTENEHLLFKAYSEQKEENENLQHTIVAMKKQLFDLQEQINILTEEKAAWTRTPTNPPTTTQKSSAEPEYCTDEEELAKETEWIRVKSRKKRKLSSSPTQTHESDTEKKQVGMKPKKVPQPPPIIVSGVSNYQSFYDLIKTCMSNANQPNDTFTVKTMGEDTIKINAYTDDAYRTLSKFFTENKYIWHSYENKQERPIRVMAKKLHHSCQPNRIMEDLIDKGFKIQNVVNKLRWQSKEPLNMFMLTFNHEEDINKIHNIKSILGCKVEIQALKSPKLVPQCKRCQAYGHTQKYCSREPRCVKCTGKHLTIDCKKPADEKPKCVHCGGSHPANYRGCMIAKEMQNIKKNRTKRSTTVLHRQQHAYADRSVIDTNIMPKSRDYSHGPTTKKITYAQTVAAKPNTNNQQQKSSLENKLDAILKYMYSFDERLKILEGSTKKLRQHQNNE